MELHHYFLGLIGSVSVIHLLTVASQCIGKLQMKGQPLAGYRPESAGKRSDWYVFFHCADLLGKEEGAATSMPTLPDRPASTTVIRQEKDRRPRIRARMA